MRKLVLIVIATLSLGTFALAQSMDNQGGNAQGASDWYNQKLSAQVQDFARIKAALAPSETSFAQGGQQPGSMASNLGEGANLDWYNQKLSEQVQEFNRINATLAPSQTAPSE